MTTRQQAVDTAGRSFAEGRALRDSLPVAEAARLAWTPTGPSIAELEQRIAAQRGIKSPARTRVPVAASGEPVVPADFPAAGPAGAKQPA